MARHMLLSTGKATRSSASCSAPLRGTHERSAAMTHYSDDINSKAPTPYADTSATFGIGLVALLIAILTIVLAGGCVL